MIRLPALFVSVVFTVAATSVWADILSVKQALRSAEWEGTWSLDCSKSAIFKQVNAIPNSDDMPYTELYSQDEAFARKKIVDATWDSNARTLFTTAKMDGHLFDIKIGEYTLSALVSMSENSMQLLDSEVSFTSFSLIAVPVSAVFAKKAGEIQPGETISIHAVSNGTQSNPDAGIQAGPVKPLNRCS